MLQSVNPATGRVLRDYEPMSSSGVAAVLETTAAVAAGWARVGVDRRAAFLSNAAAILDAEKEEYARLITQEMGKPFAQACAEVGKCAWLCRYYAENGPGFLRDEAIASDAKESFVAYQPLGVVLAVMPWNFPFWQVFRFAAPALTAGNGAVLKHASNVTGCALAIEAILQEAGYPEHLFRTLLIESRAVPGVIENDAVKAVTLTGSEAAGAAVAAAAGKALKKTVLELGGSDPYLVLDDADIAHAAATCAQSRLINSGQSCIAAKRFLVDKRVSESFTHRLIAEMAQARVGDPMDAGTAIGPLARGDLRETLHRQVTESVAAGARLRIGGAIPEGPGNFYPATVLTDVRPGMAAFDEEVFGPVAAVVEVDDEDEAVRMANQSAYGLGAAVFTRDIGRGKVVARRIESGCCAVNDLVRSDPRLPFGGIKRSGYGRELSTLGIREFVNIKTICAEDPPERA